MIRKLGFFNGPVTFGDFENHKMVKYRTPTQVNSPFTSPAPAAAPLNFQPLWDRNVLKMTKNDGTTKVHERRKVFYSL